MSSRKITYTFYEPPAKAQEWLEDRRVLMIDNEAAQDL